jgi:hypothetical protein
LSQPTSIQPGGPQSKPKGAPGTAALWLSILGFCGITALIGVVLGFLAMSEAKKTGQSTTKGLLAVIIGFVWLVPLSIAVIVSGFAGGGSNSTTTPTTTPSAQVSESTAPTPSPSPSPDGDATDQLRAELIALGFTCKIGDQELRSGQCTKGSYEDPEYGETSLEFLNIIPDESGKPLVEGSLFPETAKQLKDFGLEVLGDDGSGQGTVVVVTG